jgi:hypothetical protein
VLNIEGGRAREDVHLLAVPSVVVARLFDQYLLSEGIRGLIEETLLHALLQPRKECVGYIMRALQAG